MQKSRPDAQAPKAALVLRAAPESSPQPKTVPYQAAGTDGEDYGANIDDVSLATGEPL